MIWNGTKHRLNFLGVQNVQLKRYFSFSCSIFQIQTVIFVKKKKSFKSFKRPAKKSLSVSSKFLVFTFSVLFSVGSWKYYLKVRCAIGKSGLYWTCSCSFRFQYSRVKFYTWNKNIRPEVSGWDRHRDVERLELNRILVGEDWHVFRTSERSKWVVVGMVFLVAI
jgi:hypothetical protein